MSKNVEKMAFAEPNMTFYHSDLKMIQQLFSLTNGLLPG